MLNNSNIVEIKGKKFIHADTPNVTYDVIGVGDIVYLPFKELKEQKPFPKLDPGMKVEVRQGGCTDVQIVRNIAINSGVGLWRWNPESEMVPDFCKTFEIYQVWDQQDKLLWKRDE